jgi:hypothetical protein
MLIEGRRGWGYAPTRISFILYDQSYEPPSWTLHMHLLVVLYEKLMKYIIIDLKNFFVFKMVFYIAYLLKKLRGFLLVAF